MVLALTIQLLCLLAGYILDLSLGYCSNGFWGLLKNTFNPSAIRFVEGACALFALLMMHT